MENLKSFLDGELDLAGKAEVETHLRQDAELAKMSADFSALSGALKGVDPGQPYGLDKLQARLSTTAVAESKKIWRFAGWSSVMGLLLVVAMIPLLQQPKSAAKSLGAFRNESAGEMAAAGAIAAPATQMSTESSAADSVAEPFNAAGRASDESLTKGFAKKSMDYTAQEQSRTAFKDRVTTGGLLPAEDEAKLNLSIGKNSPGAPYGVYLEKSGNISIEVEDLMRAVDEATGMVTGLKGFVVTSDMQNTEEGGSARMTLRIPSDNFPAAMNKLQGMGEVRQVNSASQDITGETVTSAAKTRSWADQEKQLIDELAKSKNRDEKWRIRGELSNVRANLEAEKSQLNNLKERGNFSTIEVTFTRGASGGGWAKGAFGDATSGLGSIGQVVGTLGIYFLVFIPVWLPLAIAGWIVNRRRR
jgi:hypothetical protein